MAFQATLDDWLSILGVRTRFTETFDGRRTVAGTMAALDAARNSWPDVSQDYVGILEVARQAVIELRPLIREQAQWLQELRERVTEINAIQEYIRVDQPPATPADRLLDAGELSEVRRLLDDINEAVGAIENDPRNRETEDI